MTGRVVYTPPLPHRCEVPLYTVFAIGTIWLCDQCKTYWTRKDTLAAQHWFQSTQTELEEAGVIGQGGKYKIEVTEYGEMKMRR